MANPETRASLAQRIFKSLQPATTSAPVPAPAPAPAPSPAPAPVNPLDSFASLFEQNKAPTPAGDNKNATSDNKDTKAPTPKGNKYFSMTPEEAMGVASNMNFSGAINKEDVAKALSGDADALISIMNKQTQLAMASAMTMSGNMIDKAFTDQVPKLQTDLEGNFSKFQSKYSVDSALASDATLSHKAIQPLAKQIAAGLIAQNPNMSKDELVATTKTFFNQAATALSGKKQGAEFDGIPDSFQGMSASELSALDFSQSH